MRGQILATDAAGGGVISASDGNRYTFSRSDWKGLGEPPGGAEVDFIAREGAAEEIFPLPASSGGLGGAAAAAARPVAPPPVAPRRDEGSSVTLGIIGILCLALGFAIPILPTIAAFVLGLIGASSAKRHDNSTGLIASRIAWIGAVVFVVVAVVLIVVISIYAWPFLETLLEYFGRVLEEEAGRVSV